MGILIGDRELGDDDARYIDFDSPVKMTSEQKEEFIKLLKYLFVVVEEEPVNDFRPDRLGGDKLFTGRRWTVDEYEVILQVEDTGEVAKKLGRTWMGAHIQRGSFYPEFISWANKEGKDLLKGNIKELIKEFMKSKEEAIKKRRAKKLKINRKLKKLKEELQALEEMEKRGRLELYINTNMMTMEQFNNRKQKLINQIKALET